VCILVLKKCRKSGDVLFIHAVEHFAKGKRQNQPTTEHIDKIVDTYQFRREEDHSATTTEEAISLEDATQKVNATAPASREGHEERDGVTPASLRQA